MVVLRTVVMGGSSSSKKNKARTFCETAFNKRATARALFHAPRLVHDGAMISVVIPTLNSERALPRCFDSLIPAAVRGVVREVIIADGGSTDGTLGVADAAGAHVV